jgi:hypothetical protein
VVGFIAGTNRIRSIKVSIGKEPLAGQKDNRQNPAKILAGECGVD